MDRALVQRRTRETLERVDEPKEFTRGLQELFQVLVDREATKNYPRIIPDTGKFY